MKFLKLPFVCFLVVCGAMLFVGCEVSVTPAVSTTESSAKTPVEDENTIALRERATEFGDLLMRLRTMTADEGHYELQFFIAPSPQLREQVMSYYRDFSAKSEKFTIISQSVTDIKVDASGTRAQVTYDLVATAPNGSKIPAEQETTWVQVDGQWYRAISDPTKRLK